MVYNTISKGGDRLKTVKEVSRLSGVSVRTLHHYDNIGLLKPTQVTEAGYRLYDDAAMERLYLILVFREFGLPLKEIKDLLDGPEENRNRMLENQIRQMQHKVSKLNDQIAFAKGISVLGVNYMNFEGFNPDKMDDYSAQAKTLYGKTDAYKEYEHKSKNRSKEQEQNLGGQVMDFFARLGKMRPCAADCEAAQSWAGDLQSFLTANYYTCTPQILQCLAESYAGGGSMTENIDRVGGSGTGAFAKEVIDIYVKNR
jgi:DNA-binding transcriptional MerR regulator